MCTHIWISFPTVEPSVCPTKSTTTTTSPLGGAVPRNAECEDSPKCQENGILHETSCEFTPWAIANCPKTCGTCGLKTRIDNLGEQVILILVHSHSCF